MASADLEIEAARDAARDAASLEESRRGVRNNGAAAAAPSDEDVALAPPALQSKTRLRNGGSVLEAGPGSQGSGVPGSEAGAPAPLTKFGALSRTREASTAGGPHSAVLWRSRSLPSLLAAPESVTGLPAGASLDVLKIDVEGAEWDAIEGCLDAGRSCWGRIRQLAVELHVLPRGGFKDASGAVDGELMSRRTKLLRRLREEAGFEGVRFHVNPMGPSVSLVPASRTGLGEDMPCCGEALFVRREGLEEAAAAQDDDA